jgi:hypothetical protein
MTEPPSAPVATGLQDADHPENVTPLTRRMHPLLIAGIVLLFLLLALLAAVVFLGITIGVTVLAANLIPKPANAVLAPLLGVGVAFLCFGGASRIRRGMFKNRYGLLHRPPRDPSGRRRGRRQT